MDPLNLKLSYRKYTKLDNLRNGLRENLGYNLTGSFTHLGWTGYELWVKLDDKVGGPIQAEIRHAVKENI